MKMKAMTPLLLAVAVVSFSLVSGCGEIDVNRMDIDARKARIDARTVLFQAVGDKNRVTRSKAIEAMAATIGVEGGKVYEEALSDPAPKVRFAATLAIGDLQYSPAKDKLLGMAKYKVHGAERDPRVYCGVIYALYRLGNTEHAPDIKVLLFHREKSVRKNAAEVLKKIGDPSAIELLKKRLYVERNAKVRIQILKALAMLGDKWGINKIEGNVNKGVFQEHAVETLGRMRVKTMGRKWVVDTLRVLKSLLNSFRQPMQVRVLAAESMARIGHVDEFGYNLCLTSSRQPREVLEEVLKELLKDAMEQAKKSTTKADLVQAKKSMKVEEILDEDVLSLQRFATISLGWMKRLQAVDVLHPLLKHHDDGVRVAAAMSILRILSDNDRTANAE